MKIAGVLRHDERTVSKWRIIIQSLVGTFFDGNNIVTADQKHRCRILYFRCNGPGFAQFIYIIYFFFTPNKWMSGCLNCDRGPVRHPVYSPFHLPYKKCVNSVAKLNSHYYDKCYNWNCFALYKFWCYCSSHLHTALVDNNIRPVIALITPNEHLIFDVCLTVHHWYK